MATSQDDTRIIFKANGERGEFFVFGNPDLVLKWRQDKTIPLIETIQSFDVFETVNGGNEGIAGRPSKQRLENAFGTTNTEEIIKQILEQGIIHNTHKGRSKPGAASDHRNISRGQGVSSSYGGQAIHN
ncbi:hypothetical protein G9A89_003371 [Geosiphon pyriformis]|nr:hypothetical protein G9A89_003371 [Geosiphon pyriformis]